MRGLNTGSLRGAALALALLIPGAAQATGSISCTDMKADSGVDILLGAGPVSNVLRVTIALGERQLTTEPSLPGERVTIGYQAAIMAPIQVRTNP